MGGISEKPGTIIAVIIFRNILFSDRIKTKNINFPRSVSEIFSSFFPLLVTNRTSFWHSFAVDLFWNKPAETVLMTIQKLFQQNIVASKGT